MNSTEQLIDRLVQTARPVTRLGSPFVRAGGWLALAVAAICGVIAVDGLCPNLGTRLTDPLYVAALVSAGVTGGLAAVSAFMTGMPDRSRLWALLPVPPGVAWLGSIALSCAGRWTSAPSVKIQPASMVHCTGVFMTIGLILCALLVVMLRSAPLRRQRGMNWLTGVAVAGLATTGFSITRTFDAPALMIVWNVGAGVLTVLAVAAIWPRLVNAGWNRVSAPEAG